jgi:hypothetical protein
METIYRMSLLVKGEVIFSETTKDMKKADKLYQRGLKMAERHDIDEVRLWQDIHASHDCFPQIIRKWERPGKENPDPLDFKGPLYLVEELRETNEKVTTYIPEHDKAEMYFDFAISPANQTSKLATQITLFRRERNKPPQICRRWCKPAV